MFRANAVAALSCTGLDGQSKIPTITELDTYLEAHK
jgi:sulfofructose kinase